MKERVKRIGEENRKPFKRLKKKKKNLKRLSFIAQFKIEFLLPFTGYRKVHGKMTGTILSETELGKTFPSLNWKGVV